VAMRTNGCGDPNTRQPRRQTVAIVTGGSVGAGREIARTLAKWGWAIVVVYLEPQRATEATVAEILSAEGTIVTVRADLADDLDVERLFAESTAAFGGVDVVVHPTPERPALLLQHAARNLRRGGAIVSAASVEGVTPAVARALDERHISVFTSVPDKLVSLLERWGGQVIH
jgi:short chain dehydrogenase